MRKKIGSVLFIAAMTCAMLVGCGNGEDKESSKTRGTDENWQTYQEKSGDESEMSIDWWLVGGQDNYYQYYWSEMIGLKKIQEICGININFKVAQSYDVYLPMMTAKSYPDVITGYNLEKYRGRMSSMYYDEVSADLGNYMEEWMPNFSRIIEEYPKIGQDLRLDTGEYTFVSSLYDVDDKEDRIAASERGLGIRQDWLDEVGMDIPETMEEWYNVLLAFKNYDPNGNGLQDEEPVNMCSSGWKYFLPAYGIDDDPSIDENGNVVYGFMTESYKEYLTELNKWSNEGLIYNMFENTSIEKMKERVTGNYAGAWKASAGDFDVNDSGSFISILRDVAPNAEFAAAPWPKTADGYQWCFSDISSFARDTTVITDLAVKNGRDKAAAYIIDYMLSESGSAYLNWGVEGESYEVVNGEKQKMDGMKKMVEFRDEKIPTFNTYADPITVMLPQFGQIASYVLSNMDESYYKACETWSKGDTSYKILAPCQLSVEQEQEVDQFEDNMKNYIARMRMRFIESKVPLTDYDAYVEQVKIMGGEEFVKIWQSAYDAYLER